MFTNFSTLKEEEVQKLIEIAQEDLRSLEDEDDETKREIGEEIEEQLVMLKKLREPIPVEEKGTIGAFLRDYLETQITSRLRKLLEIGVPNVILRHEAKRVLRCRAKKPVEGWEKYRELKILDAIEKIGRGGKTFLEMQVEGNTVFLFTGRWGQFLNDKKSLPVRSR